MQDVCLTRGHLSCATILVSDPLFPCMRCLFSRTSVPHNGRGIGMRSSLSQLSIPCCAKFYKLSHRQVVTVVRAGHYTLPGSYEQEGITMDTCVYMCVYACDQNNLPQGSEIEVSLGWQYFSLAGKRDFCVCYWLNLLQSVEYDDCLAQGKAVSFNAPKLLQSI